MAANILRKRFTVTDFHRMGETGILSERDRVELLNGEILEMSPIGTRHAAVVTRIADRLYEHLPPQALIRVQNPIHLDDFSEPPPDLALLHWRDDYYASGHPRPDNIFALIEVADTTLEFDRTTKVLLYAKAGIRETWLVDLKGDRLEIYRQPSLEGYRDIVFAEGDRSVTFQAFPSVEWAVGEILG